MCADLFCGEKKECQRCEAPASTHPISCSVSLITTPTPNSVKNEDTFSLDCFLPFQGHGEGAGSCPLPCIQAKAGYSPK